MTSLRVRRGPASVLAEGLVRTLQERDPAAARHAAAVAAFARDIAAALGMDARRRVHAHLAGLLHDVGMVALADRVIAGERRLSFHDWTAIERHPDLGAALLGGSGPVSDAVRAHHERPDGRGYPLGLAGEAIPPLARVVAVAEVYDTLTGGDGYRRAVSSFAAVRELRAVADTQLDAGCVAALVGLLQGRATDYRHADRASVETELLVQRTR